MNRNKSYAVSGGHQYTVDAAQQILDNGGNAIDAAIAAYWMCMVAEPFMASAGAGGFAMIREPQGNLVSMDFFCQTPKSKRKPVDSDLFPITVDFGTTTEDFYVGMASVAVPGAIAALWEMHRRWATIPMKELVQPAISATKMGVALDAFQTYECELLECIFKLDPRGRSIFFNESGDLKQLGEKISLDRFPDFAESMAIEGEDLFYRGEIANTIVKLCNDKGGNLSMQDFNDYRLNITSPFSYNWKGYTVNSNPFPSVGAMIQACMLKEIEVDGSQYRSGSAKHFSQISNISKKIYDLKSHLSRIQNHLRSLNILIPNSTSKSHKWGGTSHFNIVDNDGMAISLSTSIGEGNGTFVPGTDMQLNNMLGELSLLPNGIHNWETDVRLQSMMCPTMITKDNKLQMLIGSGGAGRIPFAMAQTINNHLNMKMSLSEAVDFSRIIYDGVQYQVEQGYEHISDTIDYKSWDTSSLYFGGTHAISSVGKVLDAVGDPRRHGKAIS